MSAYGGTFFPDWDTYLVVTSGFLTDRYPPFTLGDAPTYPVRLYIEEQIEGRNRITCFLPIRLILLIPHFIVLFLLAIVVTIATIVAWIVGTIRGRLPGVLHTFIAGYERWAIRVTVYAALLVDEYPPFSLE